ncbi:MAG: type II toxin-antitoxin system HicA family toxin [Candidatus Longimicrobiales bacterium M2_2A_002]
MKRKHQRTYDNIKANNGGTHWSDVENLLKSEFEAEVYEGTGSTVTFVVKGVKLTVDRPHPRRECGRGLVSRVRAFIEEVE